MEASSRYRATIFRVAFERIRAAGGLCIVDEVQCGIGRTGDHIWAFTKHGVVPDIMVIAKGIGNGIPLAAVVAKREITEVMANKFYFHTYGANPVACSAGRAVLKTLDEYKLIDNAKQVGAALLDVLKRLKSNYSIIGDVRGRGLMMAIELVKDQQTKEPASEEMAKLFELTRQNGLVASKSGAYRNVLRICPPLCIQMDDVVFFEQAINKSFEQLQY